MNGKGSYDMLSREGRSFGTKVIDGVTEKNTVKMCDGIRQDQPEQVG